MITDNLASTLQGNLISTVARKASLALPACGGHLMKKRALAAVLSAVILGQTALANPRPPGPGPAPGMPLERMWIDIQHSAGTLHASFVGDFYFSSFF